MEMKLRGGIKVYRNGKLIASTHNDVTASFVLSLIKSLFGASSFYGGYFGMPKTAVVKLSYKDTPVTSAVLSHVTFTEETIAGYEHTRVIYSFSDSSRTKYKFNSLQLWTSLTNSLLLHVSDADLNSPLTKNPEDVVQVDWWVELVTGQPFTFILQYLKQQQATYCSSTCTIPPLAYNMQTNFGAFNMMFALLTLPNILSVARSIKSNLTNALTQILPSDENVSPLGMTKIACVDLCQCGNSANNAVYPVNGFVSETVGGEYVYVAFNFNNPCPSGQYVIPISTINLGSSNAVDLAVVALPSDGTGNSALIIKIPYGSATLVKLTTHQGE
jgi:hypothetical protein